jgi:hypothetical protein
MDMLQRQKSWAYKLLVMRENRAKDAYEKWNAICIRKSEEGNNALKVLLAFKYIFQASPLMLFLNMHRSRGLMLHSNQRRAIFDV